MHNFYVLPVFFLLAGVEYPDAIPESVVIKDTFGSSYKQSQEKFTPSPSPSPSSIVNFSGLALLLIRRTYP